MILRFLKYPKISFLAGFKKIYTFLFLNLGVFIKYKVLCVAI